MTFRYLYCNFISHNCNSFEKLKAGNWFFNAILVSVWPNYAVKAMLLCVFLSVSQKLWNQATGLPFFEVKGAPITKNFTPEDYGAHRQNWCVLQDQRGVLLVGNNDGLLSYDGVTWRANPLPNGSVVRSLAMDEQGRIYYGAKGDFGYLSANAQGVIQFISLSEQIPAETRNYKDIWEIKCLDGKIYFQAYHYIFVVDAGSITKAAHPTVEAIHSPRRTLCFAAVHGRLYAYEEDVGLKYLTGSEFQYVPGGDFFEDISIIQILPFFSKPEADQLLLCSLDKGLYTWDGQRFSPFQMDKKGAELLSGSRISEACYLSDGALALGTSVHGVLLLNESGDIVQSIDQDIGLLSNSIITLYPDHQGGLWIGNNRGLARVETPMAFSFFSTPSGLNNLVYDITRHQDKLYVGTDAGLFVAPSETGQPFTKIEGVNSNAFSVLSTQNELLIAFPYAGLFQLKGNTLTKLFSNVPIKLVQSRFDERIVFVGGGSSHFGFSILYQTPQGWKRWLTQPMVKEEIRYVVEESPGIIWLGSRNDGFIRVEIPHLQKNNETGFSNPSGQDSLKVQVEMYSKETGGSKFRARPFLIQNQTYFASNEGFKRIDRTTGQILPDDTFGPLLADTLASIDHLMGGQDGEIWINAELIEHPPTGISKLIPTGNNSYSLRHIPIFNRLKEYTVTSLFSDSHEPGVLLIGTTGGLIKYDPAVSKNYAANYNTLTRTVLSNGDSLVYQGEEPMPNQASTSTTLSYHNNALRFEYAAASFEASDQNKFQVYLEGFDKGWPNWTEETKKDYTNLPEGKYIFRVRSKNIYDVLGQEATFPFRILPPWYRTWQAMLSYFILGLAFFVLSLWSYNRWRTRLLQNRTRELEQIVADRTAKLAERNDQLEHLNTTQSRFFANISHEFRTPLTLILGPAGQSLKAISQNRIANSILNHKIIIQNGRRLLSLVNQILDLNKLEAGKMSVQYVQGDIIVFLRRLCESLHSLAELKGVDFQFTTKVERLIMDYDPDKLTKIVSNLLSNAIKFTPKGGRVETIVYPEESNLLVCVKDTGRGIPNDQLPFIFDRFYQADVSANPQNIGSGVGLALTKELAKLLGGSIYVESQLGEGAAFFLQLPVRREATRSSDMDNIIEANEAFSLSGKLSVSAAEDKTPPEDLAPNEALPKAHILIIEDNEDMANYIASCLGNRYAVDFAENGGIGVDKALEQVPDLIISDVMMPLKDGFDVCKELKANEKTSHIPIILLTARAEATDRIAGLKRGADAYLAKPFDELELQVRVDKLLEIRNLLRQRFGTALSNNEVGPNAQAGTALAEGLELEAVFLTKVNGILGQLFSDAELHPSQLAADLNMSPRQFRRKINALTGQSPTLFIRNFRLQKANKLLADSELTISEIAWEVGFKDSKYFSRVYTNEFGISPSEVRAR